MLLLRNISVFQRQIQLSYTGIELSGITWYYGISTHIIYSERIIGGIPE